MSGVIKNNLTDAIKAKDSLQIESNQLIIEQTVAYDEDTNITANTNLKEVYKIGMDIMERYKERLYKDSEAIGKLGTEFSELDNKMNIMMQLNSKK